MGHTALCPSSAITCPAAPSFHAGPYFVCESSVPTLFFLSLWRITLSDPVCRNGSPAPLLITLCPSWFSPWSPEPTLAALGS